ncbi:hypothetical protein KC19_8G192400 [Ceratodon purpureus]|uniref:BTB domain-containing protein n=1 Tax=Ceratodon purpureus TaxID=3225 RepID=A0A8T0H4Y8_CERPU|nr:hypothetical protein KC19_8G192400 [Ceratodon purpureus]
MEMLPAAPLNVDVTKFFGDDMEKNVSILKMERQSNELVLFKMLEEGLNADITLRAQGGSVKAHRCVLSAVSPVFRAMFQHDMKEQLSSIVDIPDMTIEGLKLFLLVLYTINERIIVEATEYEETEPESLPWLFRAGIDKYFDEFIRALLKYQAFRRRLRCLLEAALCRNLTPSNCWEYYDIALQFNDEYISLSVNDYIVDNFRDVLGSTEFLSEMRRNPDRVYSILNGGWTRLISVALRKHMESTSKTKRARQH